MNELEEAEYQIQLLKYELLKIKLIAGASNGDTDNTMDEALCAIWTLSDKILEEAKNDL